MKKEIKFEATAINPKQSLSSTASTSFLSPSSYATINKYQYLRNVFLITFKDGYSVYISEVIKLDFMMSEREMKNRCDPSFTANSTHRVSHKLELKDIL